MKLGWAGIAAVVLAYDGWALASDRDTLSRQFRETRRSHPMTMAAVTTYMVLHLYGTWPPKADPFNLFAAGCRSLR